MRLRTVLAGASAVAIVLGLFAWPHVGHGIDWSRHAPGVLLVSGAAFTVLGLVCFVVPSMPSQPFPRHLHWLGSFALLHGSKQFFEAGPLAAGLPAGEASALVALWQLASVVALLEFSRRLWRGDASLPAAPAAWLLSPWLYGVLALLTVALGLAWGALPAMQLAASWLVAFPGAALGAAWLWRHARRVALGQGAGTTLALALGAYALLAAVVVDGGAGAPAWLSTADAFEAAAGVPVDLLRALCAGVAALALCRLAMLHLLSVAAQAEDKAADLARSELALREAQRLAQVGSWELDLGSGKLSWSDEIFRIFEVDRSRFGATYEGFLGAIHPEDRHTVDTAYTQSLADRAPYGIEHRLLMSDGRVKWVQERGFSEFDAEGKPLRSLGTVQDITERVLAQQSLRETQALLAEAQKLARLGNWILDPLNGTAYWSEEQYRLLGYEPGAVEAGLPGFLQAVHPDDRPAVQAALQRAVEPGGDGEFDIEHRIRTPEGERYLELHGRTRFDPQGRAVRLFGTSMDITERRLRELELGAHRAQLEALVRRRTGERDAQSARNALVLDTAIDGFFTTDVNSRIVEVNAAVCRLLGCSRDELLGRDITDFEADADPGRAAARADAVRRRGHARLEARLRRKDGSFVDVEVSVHLDEVAGERFFFGFVRDITERRRSERALRNARDEAERASRAKTDFMSGMSHELRTPMNAILGFSQLLRMQALSADQLDAVGEIHSAGQHLLALIDDLLDLTRIEAGQLTVTIVPVRVAAVVAEALRIAQPMIAARGLELTHALPTDVSVQADPVRLRQVLVNLLSNAAKYNRAGGRVSIDAQPAGPQRLRLRISDTGPGIPPELLPRLFKTFERLGAERSDVEGSGIGLALSKQLAERMGGSIGVESRVGQGSTFWIELPLSAGVADAAAGAPTQSGAAALAAPFEVLYIDADRASQKVLELVFQTRPGWRLRTASTGPQGLELAHHTVPDAIPLDVDLPGMAGCPVLQALRADPRTASVPVVALSADAMCEQVERGLQASFHERLAKPLDLERLLTLMSALAAAARH